MSDEELFVTDLVIYIGTRRVKLVVGSVLNGASAPPGRRILEWPEGWDGSVHGWLAHAVIEVQSGADGVLRVVTCV
jgi:hypothetical protein